MGLSFGLGWRINFYKMASPYKIPSSQYERVAIHNTLFGEIARLRKKLQIQSDMTYGKDKYKVTFLFASKKLGEMLK